MASLIVTIVIATVVAVFAGFNITNCCDVCIVFHTFQNIPVFVTALVSFAVGVVLSSSLFIARILRNGKNGDMQASGGVKASSAQHKGKKGFSLFKKNKHKDVKDVKDESSHTDDLPHDAGHEDRMASAPKTPYDGSAPYAEASSQDGR